MGSTLPVYEFAEILVHGHENPSLGGRPCQQRVIAGIGAWFACLDHIVAKHSQAVSNPLPCATIYQKSQSVYPDGVKPVLGDNRVRIG